MKTLTTSILVCAAFLLVLTSASKAMGSINISEKGQICGRIVDFTTENPLESASVELYTATGKKLVVGTLTNSKGIFTFTMIEPGEYFLEISLEGYAAFRIKSIEIKKEGGKTDVGEIQLNRVSKKNARLTARNNFPVAERNLALNNNR
jgi:uncharacterized surface anchored protein